MERFSSLFDIFNYADAEPVSRTKKKSGLQVKQLGNFTPASEEQCCLGVWRLSETRDHLSAFLDRRNLNVLQNPHPGQELRAWPCKPLLMVFSESTQEAGKTSLSYCSLCPGFPARFLEGQKSILQCGINCVRICNFWWRASSARWCHITKSRPVFHAQKVTFCHATIMTSVSLSLCIPEKELYLLAYPLSCLKNV